MASSVSDTFSIIDVRKLLMTEYRLFICFVYAAMKTNNLCASVLASKQVPKVYKKEYPTLSLNRQNSIGLSENQIEIIQGDSKKKKLANLSQRKHLMK